MSINIKVFEINFGMTHIAMRGDGQMVVSMRKSEKYWRNNWVTVDWKPIPEMEDMNSLFKDVLKELESKEPIFDIEVM